MKKYCLLTICILLCFFQVLQGKERIKKYPMKTLTDPNSPSYVPIPYPKNEKEVIADFKYAMKKIFSAPGSFTESIIKEERFSDRMIKSLLQEKNEFRIGKIFKVDSRNYGDRDDYYWLILIFDREDAICGRVIMKASGLWGETSAYPEENNRPYFLSDKEIKKILSERIGEKTKEKGIGKIKRISFDSGLGHRLLPVWEIKMLDNSIFYYCDIKKSVYKIQKKVKLKKDRAPDGRHWLESITSSDYCYDSVNDELLYFKKIKKQK